MADIEKRVDNLEKEVNNIKLELNNSLKDIQSDVSIIKERIMNKDESNDLQNQIIIKDVKSNTERIEKLESNQSKLLWLIIGEIVALIGGVIKYFLSV